MRSILSLAFVGFVLAACTVETDKMNNKDAVRAYFGPAVCKKSQECQPVNFFLAFSTDESLDAPNTDETRRLERVACEKGYNDREQAIGTKLTDCTNEGWQKCRSDIAQTACPNAGASMTFEEFQRTSGIGELPESCTTCNND